MQLAHPHLLWLFLIFIPVIAWYILRQRDSHPAMSLSSTTDLAPPAGNLHLNLPALVRIPDSII